MDDLILSLKKKNCYRIFVTSYKKHIYYFVTGIMENIHAEIIMIKNSVFLFHRPNPCQDRQDFLSVPLRPLLLSTILPWHHTVYYYYFCYSITRQFVPPVEYQIHNRNTYIKTTIIQFVYIIYSVLRFFFFFLRIKR